MIVPTLRLQQLYALFLALAFVLWAVLGFYAQISLRQISHRADDEAQRAARAEIARTVETLELRLRSLAERLAAWDETRQHLTNPEYYPLWRDVRTRDTGMLPPSMHIDLYRPNGAILAKGPGATMPAQMPHKGSAEVVLRWDAQRPQAYYRFPIRVHPDSDVLLGYGIIRLDPLHEIHNQGPFRYIDATSLGLRHDAVQVQHIRDLSQHLELRAQPNPVLTAALDEVRRLSLYAALLALVLALAFFFALRQLVVRPIRRLSAQIQALRDNPEAQAPGSSDYRPNLLELLELQRAFEEYHRRLRHLHEEIQRSSHRFYEQARQDALTGVYNRRAFDEDRARLERDKRVDECTLILFDCDHFKAINDTYGHPVGDMVIRAMATCLTQALRADDRLYRLGGDEFATLMPGTSIETARRAAERCLEQVGRYDFAVHGITEPVTISIGLAHARAPFDLTALHKAADLAMYSAKRPGCPKIAVYEESLDALSALVSNREVSAVYAAIRQPS
ncbi:MAG: diguanylate cyclase, partial [Thiobacillaceae bacterium]